MKPRHLTALAVALTGLAGVLLSSCSPEYTWTRKYDKPAGRYEWMKVTPDVMYAMCSLTFATYPNLGACAFYGGNGGDCYVYSYFSEEEAKRAMSGDGLTLYEHEVGDGADKPFGHCNGWDHNVPQNRTTGL